MSNAEVRNKFQCEIGNKELLKVVLETNNVTLIDRVDEIYLFAGKSLIDGETLLLSTRIIGSEVACLVNCINSVLANILISHLKSSFENSQDKVEDQVESLD